MTIAYHGRLVPHLNGQVIVLFDQREAACSSKCSSCTFLLHSWHGTFCFAHWEMCSIPYLATTSLHSSFVHCIYYTFICPLHLLHYPVHRQLLFLQLISKFPMMSSSAMLKSSTCPDHCFAKWMFEDILDAYECHEAVMTA